MRKDGTVFNVATKAIPVIVTRKFRSFQAAEASVEELSKKDVSDFEGKKKQLKSNKKRKCDHKRNDYNELCTAIVHKQHQDSGSTTSSVRASKGIPQTVVFPPVKTDNLPEQDALNHGSSSPFFPRATTHPPLPLEEPLDVLLPVASSSNAPLLITLAPQSKLSVHQMPTVSPSSTRSVEVQNNIITLPHFEHKGSIGIHEAIPERETEPLEWTPQRIQVKA
ncbi:uncharacterized protein LOC110678778 [Aedes aegypti]|uniref:Uncharacterized protein n=1 Tax=Aedes aegypti TaxID=7159 RepID=A0A6I8U8H4_AEDAE|nr:uncharacterized protein LOC110678778 [Aedes aegypti]